jgi:hypothetical protein
LRQTIRSQNFSQNRDFGVLKAAKTRAKQSPKSPENSGLLGVGRTAQNEVSNFIFYRPWILRHFSKNIARF